MSENIGDIEEWKNKYSFLNEIWDVYDKFDKNTEGDDHVNLYTGVCQTIISKYGKDKEKYENFCKQLVRNLGCYPGNNNFFNPNSSKCQILYYWIYNSVKKYNIPGDVIKECFNDYISFMGSVKVKANCNYNSYDELYKEPMSLILLDIFDSSMESIRNVLLNSNEPTKKLYQNYVCECVKTYKDVYRKYCPNSDSTDIKGYNTCFRLSTLKQIYEHYLFNLESLKNKIPSLDADENDYSNKCILPAKKLEPVTLSGVREENFPHLTEALGRNTDRSLPSREVVDGNKGSHVSSTVSTTLGTVAGASSILALLYKVNTKLHLNV
ncbi:hypothetical protein PVIIG_06117 [Plasmodium vivax India VII]|uniref:Uncharacterized protein n=1 Tax=Plasmodium vivax India VII TaxID=1077284 RepID=A0A0J9S337_PLAVI|nr:hypothetical protein PVIIG_06117 [Plasmodium vivax India VII]